MTRIFNLVFLLLSLMAIFRYGQGTDYFNYQSIYDNIKLCIEDGNIALAFVVNPDVGFTLLNIVAIYLGIPYPVFQGIFTAVIMLFFYKFLSNRCRYSFASLLLFYCIIYMIYALSAVRQGICMAAFYAFLYPLLLTNRTKKYIILTIVLTLIHGSSILFLLFPFFNKIKIREKRIRLLFIFSLIVLLIGSSFFAKIPIGFLQSRISVYMEEQSSNMLIAKVLRTLLVVPLFYMPKKLLDDKELYFCRKMMFLGYCIYSITSFSELASSRLWVYFLGFECLILSRLTYIKFVKNYRKIFVIYYIMIAMVLWIKDIGAAISQGGYRNCTAFTYPYISQFDSSEYFDYYRKDRGVIDKTTE